MNFPQLKSKFTDSGSSVHSAFIGFRLIGPVIIVATGVLMISISWLKWPDLMVDFGEQVYHAWQFSEGKVIYKDLTYLYGPFSGYLHALVFKLFGPGILTLAIFNIFVTIALSFLIYILIKNSSNQLTATVCSLAFLTLFAFGQYQGGGNFNFICAYVYELPHGVALSLLTLYLFSKYIETNAMPWLITVYFLVGLVFLTKPEVFLAIAIALPTGTALSFYLQSASKRIWVRNIFICIGSFLAAPLLFYIHLSFHLSFEQAFTSIISPWGYVQNPSNLSLPLYQWVLGINAIEANLTKMFTYFLTGIAIIFSITIVNRFLTKLNYSSRPIVISLGMLSAGLLCLLLKIFPLLELLRPLPLITLLLTVYYFTLLMRKKTSNPKNLLVLFSFSLFSFALLFKIILNTHVYHYGFALALPGTLIFIRWVLYEYPNHKIKHLGSTDFYLATIVTLSLAIFSNHIAFSRQMYQLKGYSVGSGKDTLLDYYPELDPRGLIVSNSLKYIQNHIEPGAGIATIPFGNMINYMTRHPNPLKVSTINPVEAQIFGEDNFLNDIKSSSPKYILFVDVDSSILGSQNFGMDYANNVYQWIIKNYLLEKQFGATPFTGAGFGIQILKRKSLHSEQ